MNDYGELLDEQTVRFERLLPGPIERVWSYLTESDDDIPRPDKYKDMPLTMSFAGKVTRCEPPHVLQHTWEFEDENSEVCYELTEEGDKVRLVLTHRRLDTKDIVLSVSGGWHTHLNVLVDVLNGDTPRPFYKMQTQLETEYSERLGMN